MKKSFLLLAISLLTSFYLIAQPARISVFTQNGERFFAYANGKLINAGLQSNVTTKNLSSEGCVLRIVFDDKSLGEKTFNVPLKAGYEVSIMLKKNKKGEFIMSYAGESVIEEGSPEPTEQTSAQPAPTQNSKPAKSSNEDSYSQDMSVDINVGATGVSTTTKVKYTETSSSSGGNPEPAKEQNTAPAKSSACSAPMAAASFNNAKTSISDKGFEETKLTEAKQIIKSNCMSSAQIKQILALFDYEQSKLDFAKFAYKKCTDTNNYFTLNSAFSYESSVEELNTYIDSIK